MKKLILFILVALLAFACASCDGMMGNVSKNDVSSAVSDAVSKGDSFVSDAVSMGDSVVSDVVSGAEGLVSDVVSALS